MEKNSESAGIRLGGLASAARRSLTVKRVFGEPIERDGVTIVPAAIVMGGFGGGDTEGGLGAGEEAGPRGEGNASGGGFGMYARPAGVYVMDGDDVYWQPAISFNAIICASAMVAVAALCTLPRAIRACSRRRGR